jgi:tetratricopeptide (TPR) repeat protein
MGFDDPFRKTFRVKLEGQGVIMEYQDYRNLVQQADQLTDSGRLKEAEEAYYKLILSDVSDIDKTALSCSLALVYDKMGNTEEALGWFDKGVAAEQAYCRYEGAEKKAKYLSLLGRNTEAAAIYEQLVKQPFVSESEKERMRLMIKTLLSKTLGEWK